MTDPENTPQQSEAEAGEQPEDQPSQEATGHERTAAAEAAASADDDTGAGSMS